MSVNHEAEALRRILNSLPSLPWSIRVDPATMTATWLYTSPKLAAIYGVTDAELHGDPLALVNRTNPEDAARYFEAMQASLVTLAPTHWIGRVTYATGELRWIEAQSVYEREESGAVVISGQVFDITERKRTEELHRAVIDALPAGIMVMTADGKLPVYNPTAVRYVGNATTESSEAGHGVFKTDGVTLFPAEELPLQRALAGEEVAEADMILRSSAFDGDCWVHGTASPLRDDTGRITAAMVIFHDITAERALARELRARNDQLAASEESKSVLIERLRHAVDELTNPILEVWDDVLVMPIIGVVDSRRTADMVQRLLVEVARTQASFVIVDLTGVEIVDTKTADHLIKLIRKVELVGARCVLTGIRPAVSEALVDIGVDFGRITTLRNLKHGLREALRDTRREHEGRSRDDDSPPSAEPRGRDGARSRH